MDQGKCFESRLFQELSHLLGIIKTRTTALHSQSDGRVEKQQRTILNYLRKFISFNQKDWDCWVPMSLLAYRSSVLMRLLKSYFVPFRKFILVGICDYLQTC